MKKLKYEIEDSTIAELLGVQNFTNKEAAILELVKNSYDAGASKLEIIFLKNSIIFKDNGKGMTPDDIREKWMHVGKSTKENEYSFKDINGTERVYSGSKGIGRFALARLGKKVELNTSAKDHDTVFWRTDWNVSDSDTFQNISGEIGTKVIITEIRDRWTKGSIEHLKKYLSRTFKSPVMNITIEYENQIESVEEFYSEPKFGINCLSLINFKYSAVDKKLECIITSDEFKKEIKSYYKGEINIYKQILNVFDEFSNGDLKDKELSKVLEIIGNFKGELYFGIAANEHDANKFMYKYIRIPDKYEGGVILYRNSFSISSYDGSKDWIGFGKRSRKSPAAATHPTGEWRVKENNISGRIEIDKKENNMLRDLSNRQGIEENIYFEYFLKIIEKVLEVFEDHRQGIIRAVNKKNVLEETSEEEILKRILENPKYIEQLENDEKIKLVNEIQNLQKREKTYKEGLKETEKNFKYDARILNVFSTVGLKASSIAHDMQNDRNAIDTASEDLEYALKKHKVWEILDKNENKKIGAYNVPKMLENNNKINKKMSVFIGTLLQNIKRSQFKGNELNILEIMEKIKNNWERDYGKLKIKIVVDSDINFKSSEDIFKVIFDNLILNSFQQNKMKESINIVIKIDKKDQFLEIVYQDDGHGLHKKYLKNPLKILKVHETSRNDGHGLGMWIVNNTVIKTEGEIQVIGSVENNLDGSNKGFHIKFTLGSEE